MSLLMEGIPLEDPLRAHVEDKVTAVTTRGRLRPTAVRVGFTDENGPRGGGLRCAITVELPRRPVAHANGQGDSARLAFDAALGALEHELGRARERRRDVARRPKKYYIAHQGLTVDGEAALPPARRRRRSA
ncbi:MAG TPA: HPF/RaiA family ribosome-associated protein [Methylomirabilota bacterium]|nr:HPF/RaiA family ribosome-associated protein [Methylomirabilota bacterium]